MAGTGGALKALRERSGLTARDVAERAGVSESYLSRVENDIVEPSPAWIGHVARTIAEELSPVTQDRAVA